MPVTTVVFYFRFRVIEILLCAICFIQRTVAYYCLPNLDRLKGRVLIEKYDTISPDIQYDTSYDTTTTTTVLLFIR